MDGRLGTEALGLPLQTALRDERRVAVDVFRDGGEFEAGTRLVNAAIESGEAFAREESFADAAAFRESFCTHAAFVVRALDDGFDAAGNVSRRGAVLGVFCCRPKFPGRASHVCDAAFVADSAFRRKGLGRLMASCFLHFARSLGYAAAFLDLVAAKNTPFVSLLESLGFHRAAELPNALRRRDASDPPRFDNALGFFYDLLRDLPDDFDPLDCSHHRDSIVFSLR